MHKGRMCLDLKSGRTYMSRHVIFDERVFPFTMSVAKDVPRLVSISTSIKPSVVFSPSSRVLDQITEITQNNTIDTTSFNVQSSSSSHTPSSQEAISEAPCEHLSLSVHAMVTRYEVGVTKPNPMYALISQKVILKEPTSIKEALQDEGCTQVTMNEIAALEKNQT